ncbi:MAG: hypothetical protein ACOCXT_02170 [Candidatus Dojkabacteria bacterium]
MSQEKQSNQKDEKNMASDSHITIGLVGIVAASVGVLIGVGAWIVSKTKNFVAK